MCFCCALRRSSSCQIVKSMPERKWPEEKIHRKVVSSTRRSLAGEPFFIFNLLQVERGDYWTKTQSSWLFLISATSQCSSICFLFHSHSFPRTFTLRLHGWASVPSWPLKTAVSFFLHFFTFISPETFFFSAQFCAQWTWMVPWIAGGSTVKWCENVNVPLELQCCTFSARICTQERQGWLLLAVLRWMVVRSCHDNQTGAQPQLCPRNLIVVIFPLMYPTHCAFLRKTSQYFAVLK